MKRINRLPQIIRFTTLLAFAWFVFATTANAQGTTMPEERVDQLMTAYDKPNSPGGVVAVMKDGEIIFADAYGMANLNYGIPFTTDTRSNIGSVSKQFTAFAIALLAHRGKLSLDDPIRKYLPKVPDFNETIRIRHLLHHTSGLRGLLSTFRLAGWQFQDMFQQEEILQMISRQPELQFTPGSQFLYNNAGYALLAVIVERVTGEPFGAWMQSNVFGPIGMTNTSIKMSFGQIMPGSAESYAPAEFGGFEHVVHNHEGYGGTNVFTTVGDLAKWLDNFRTARVGGPEVIEQMQERGVLTNGDTLVYALGLRIDEYRGLRRIRHGGGDAGYRAMLTYFPELNAGVIVMSNYAAFPLRSIPIQVAEAFFGNKMEPPMNIERSGKEDKMTKNGELWSPPLSELRPYEGNYYSPEIKTFYTIFLEGGKLVARHRRNVDVILSPKEEDAFSGSKQFLKTVEFKRGANGRITGFFVSNGRSINVWFERWRQ